MDCRVAAAAATTGPALRALAGAGLSPQGPQDCELVLASLRHLGGDLALVEDSGGLRLALPVERRANPLVSLATAASPIFTHGAPVLDADLAVPALKALLHHLRTPILFRGLPVGSPARDAMTDAGQVRELNRWERAALRPSGDFDRWFETNFDRKRRKEFRRLQSRLAEKGQLGLLSLAPGESPGWWVKAFLELEAAGWKGTRGTALNSDPRRAAALAEGCTGLADAGRLRFWAVTLDGRPIAALYATVDGGQAWLGKIAHDPAFARFSPGVMVLLHATAQIFAEGDIACVDSCAIPGHPMIENIWRDRIAVADVVAASVAVSAWRLDLAVAVLSGQAALRRGAATFFNRLTGRHRS